MKRAPALGRLSDKGQVDVSIDISFILQSRRAGVDLPISRGSRVGGMN